MRVLTRALFALVCLVGIPSAVHAQGSISGVVKDTSGAVLPGVTVEAASPALIEKVRSVATDGGGQYTIVDLRPGTYTVTFTLPGFSTVKRDGIELSGNFVATVNADLRVGSLEETITVSGAAPVVDVQTVAQQQVMSKDVIDNIPTSRSNFSVATMIPGMNTSNPSDVGGKNSIGLVTLTTHGSRAGDQRITIDGLAIDSAECDGQCSGYLVNMGGVEELAVDYMSGAADFENGGVRVNAIPKQGGNLYSGSMFASTMRGGPPDNSSNGWMQANNLTDELIARGLKVPTDIRKLWDVNPGFGGPIKKDKLWFYAAYMNRGEHAYNGAWANKNAGDATKWLYEPAVNVQKIETYRQQTSKQLRLTWQANEKNKVALFYDFQERCSCPDRLGPLQMPESQTAWHYRYNDYAQVSWSSPITNRLLLEAAIGRHPEHLVSPSAEPADVFDPYPSNDGLRALDGLIPVTEQSTGMIYRGFNGVGDGMFDGRGATLRERFAASYITGSHSFKVGLQGNHKWRNRKKLAFAGGRNMDFRFNNGVPNQLTQYATPYDNRSEIPIDLGVFAQDRWIIGKLTANIGVRYDHLETAFPEQHLGPTYFWPDRDITFPATPWVSWNDITPRLSAAYDVFGNGKTAIKASANKYTLGIGLQGFFADGSNPITLRGVSTTRSWNDNFYPVGDSRRGNFEPDCDLTSATANAECGAMANNIFVPQATSRIDPAILSGWQNRPNNWTFSTELEQQLGPTVGMSVGYFRRVYGGFIAKDNLATTAADYTEWSYTAPVDSRLPDGGGYVVPGNYDLNPNKVGAIDGYYTFADAYGKVIEHWDGVDVGMQANLPGSLMVRGGLSTGRTLTDNCDVVAKSPEITTGTAPAGATTAIPTQPQTTFCHTNAGFETQYKALGTYTLPKVDVAISLNYQNLAGPVIAANTTVPSATAALTLGRPLSATAANATVNTVTPGDLRQERVNQLDFKFSKRFLYGRSRTTISMDLFNALNVNTVLTENQTYAAFRTPLSILQARFIKFGVQFDF